jgi:hypothetical protein
VSVFFKPILGGGGYALLEFMELEEFFGFLLEHWFWVLIDISLIFGCCLVRTPATGLEHWFLVN